VTRSGDRKAREPHLPRVESSRQGARNVAGVTFQGLAACALLLMSSDVHAVVPEGTEDIDVVLAAGRILVQAKQRSSVLTLTELADALARSAPSLASSPSGVRLAVVTDAPKLDDGLVEDARKSTARPRKPHVPSRSLSRSARR
jgi:hypothetical protein